MVQGRRHSAEEIATLLETIQTAVTAGKSTPLACSEAGVSEQTYYRWQAEFGGLRSEQILRIAHLERENIQLRRLIGVLRRKCEGLPTSG